MLYCFRGQIQRARCIGDMDICRDRRRQDSCSVGERNLLVVDAAGQNIRLFDQAHTFCRIGQFDRYLQPFDLNFPASDQFVERSHNCTGRTTNAQALCEPLRTGTANCDRSSRAPLTSNGGTTGWDDHDVPRGLHCEASWEVPSHPHKMVANGRAGARRSREGANGGIVVSSGTTFSASRLSS